MLRFSCLFLAVFLFAAPCRSDDVLRVATEGAYPPFSSFGADGRLTGFDVDIAQALCRAMRRECRIEAVKWENLLPGLVAGEYDMIVASMAKTPERETMAAFSDSYYRSRASFLAKKGLEIKTDPAGLAGRTLGTQRATMHADYLESNYAKGSAIRLYETTDDAFKAVASGEIDLMLTDSLTALDFMKTPAGADLDFVGEPLPADHVTSTSHIQVRKDDHALLEAVNKALTAVRFNGEYDRINNAYFPFSIY